MHFQTVCLSSAIESKIRKFCSLSSNFVFDSFLLSLQNGLALNSHSALLVLIKLLSAWDKNGFWLYYRRLESGTFDWPKPEPGKRTVAVTEQQLSWLLDGLSLDERNAHKEVLKRKLI